jgi:fatty-acyl-CoA synthase
MAENRLLPGGQPACPAAAISIRDPLSGEEAPHGVSGEICIRAPSLFDCYLNDPDATARAMTPDGFFRTGDVGRRTQQGFVFEARLGDTLRLGGFMVHPDEIESFLQSLPGVAAAQVVGVEHDGVLVPVAFLRARPGERVDAAGVIAACRESLARYKVPRHVEIVEAFPTTDSPNGIKIQRVRLREMADALLRETVPAASAVI